MIPGKMNRWYVSEPIPETEKRIPVPNMISQSSG
jgi:hypothetical protein